MKPHFSLRTFLAALIFAAVSFTSHAQSTNRPPRAAQGPRVVSPEVSADHKITFRILAPKAESVKLGAGDIQGLPQGGSALTKGESNVWEVTVGPVTPGSYRYNFNVDGVTV